MAKHAAAREAGGDVADGGRDEQHAQRVEVAAKGDPIDGQATPRRPSGRPRLTKAKADRRISERATRLT